MIRYEPGALREHVDGRPTIDAGVAGVRSNLESPSQHLGRVGRTNDGRIKRGTRIDVTGDVGANGGREKMAIGRNGRGRKRGTVRHHPLGG